MATFLPQLLQWLWDLFTSSLGSFCCSGEARSQTVTRGTERSRWQSIMFNKGSVMHWVQAQGLSLQISLECILGSLIRNQKTLGSTVYPRWSLIFSAYYITNRFLKLYSLFSQTQIQQVKAGCRISSLFESREFWCSAMNNNNWVSRFS